MGQRAALGVIKLLAGTPLYMGTTQKWQMSMGVKEKLRYSGGEIHPRHVSATEIEPMLTTDILNIDQFLSIANTMTLGIPFADATAPYTGVEAYMAKVLDYLERPTGSNHYKFTMTRGRIIPKTLSAKLGEDATLSLEIHPIFDGTNQSIVFATGATLPSNIAFGDVFAKGPVVINGTTIPDDINWDLDFGIKVAKRRMFGETKPRHVSTQRMEPTLKFTFEDPAQLSLLTTILLAQGATQSDFYLWRRKNMEEYYAFDSGQHVRIRVNASQGMHIPQDYGGSGEDYLQGNVTVRPIRGQDAEGTAAHAILSYATGVNIPLS